jgi:DNA segregation ATPase FtsK/SpoIIIE, S-DNA-T family
MSKETTANPVTGEIELPGGRGAIDVPSRKHEVLGILAFIGALALLLSFGSYDGMTADGAPIPGGNLIGPFGMWTAHGAFAALGAAAYIVDVCLWVFGWMLFTGRSDGVRLRSVFGVVAIVLLSAIFLHTLMDETTVLGGHAAGGAIGLVLGALMIGAVSSTGTYIITVGGVLLIVVLITDLSLYLVSRTCGILALRGAKTAGALGVRVVKAWREAPTTDDARAPAPLIVVPGALEPEEAAPPAPSEPVIVTKAKPKKKAKERPAADEQLVICRDAPAPSEAKFTTPPLSLLAPAEQASARVDRAYLVEMTERLLRVLADFGVVGEVRAIHPGPVVTMFEFQPRSGTKLSKIESLSSEIAMALEMTRVRVVAPIPGKNAVGFEIPNKERETVRLREILEDDSFAANHKAKLPLALGKDISGAPFTVDLAKMPHLLMAGTTGSGKSVSVNTMLLSLLYRYTPDDLRLLLVDPKMIEFQPYNHIPHLLLPVVTDMSQACLALKWAVDEMERRYQLFADTGSVRNLETYNAKVAKIREAAEGRKGTPLVEAETIVTEAGEVVELGEIPRPAEKLPEKLPLVVICIDELADLMMVAAKDVETSIARLAQKARAAGIHLIVATQRPSTDVVTGLIKANFPARLSCQVSSGIDSRTILGTNGAENLLGNGDMLILPPGTSDLVRVQGAFVSDDEINGVVEFLKAQGLPTYDEDILKPREGEGSASVDEDEKDEIYDQAVSIVAETQACSISMIQRRLRIGYNRAARIVEIMEKEGVVGPANGVNKRDVLIGPQ